MQSLKIHINGVSIVVRALLFSLIWWILSDGTVASWIIGVPAVLLAVVVSIALLPPVQMVWFELLKFVPFFLYRSLLGGVDVARRVFQPNMHIDPDLIAYPLQLPPGLPQVFMVNTISLLPGTLSTALNRNVLTVHVLDSQTGFLADIQAVEQRVTQIFNLPHKRGESYEKI